jgi:hypothetical protein
VPCFQPQQQCFRPSAGTDLNDGDVPLAGLLVVANLGIPLHAGCRQAGRAGRQVGWTAGKGLGEGSGQRETVSSATPWMVGGAGPATQLEGEHRPVHPPDETMSSWGRGSLKARMPPSMASSNLPGR